MNKITLHGVIKNIQPSHESGGIEFSKANLIVKREDGSEDTLTIKFKKFSNKYQENDVVSLTGNVRSFSRQFENGKSKVDVYVFTYFDTPDSIATNEFTIDGRICKFSGLAKTKSGKEYCHLTLANNIKNGDSVLNSYLPCVVWGQQATKLASTAKVGDKLLLKGQLHSRDYVKHLENGEIEFRVAFELVVLDFEEVE